MTEAEWLACDDLTPMLRAVSTRDLFPADRHTHIKTEERHQTRLLRDIRGNPFRPARIAPGLRGGAVGRLAQGIDAEQAFDDLSVLGDALEESGCTDADILAHLRSPGPHVRGCWALDIVLGKA